MRKIKKYSKGEATHYVSRAQALRKLQLSLNDFRRLCILKGVYPREPKNRRKAQKGSSSEIKILYHAKDIRFLTHEPIVWTLRDYKIFSRRTGRDRAVRDFRKLKLRLENAPEMKIDHIVKERYPTFIDAIKDLDDCLTLLFLFSTFPSLDKLPRDQSALCRRLTVEFMHAVIAGKSLRKAFISIKGYYFQADIKGQKVTWIVPHYYPFQPQKKTEVDFKLMSIFVEFYTIMLGFVNFRLYHSLNLIYPPTFPEAITETDSSKLQDESVFVSDRINALNIDLLKTDSTVVNDEEEEEMDLELLTNDGDSAKINQMKDEMQQVGNLKKLFAGLYFYINREVPREPLVFMIRCFGGKVSWDEQLFCGASFKEDDERITHQIVDRPIISKQYISRDYVQPQWIFDSVNQCKLLPTNKYFIGVELPPHLSPFYDYVINDKDDDEANQQGIHDPNLIDTNPEIIQQLEKAFQEEQEEENVEETKDDESDEEVDEKSKIINEKKKNMKVVSGVVHTENPEEVKADELQERHLKAKMVKGQHRFLFKKLLKEKRDKQKEERILQQKRKIIADEQKTKRVKAN